jgi:amino acid adenylation domain-containing protein
VRTVTSLFERQAANTPRAVAVRFSGGHLTYAELDTRANQLAHRLIAAGVTTETPVALAVDRSLEAIVCMLGVLKAGGAYLALDHRMPVARQRAVIDDAGVRVVLADRDVDESAEILRVDGERGWWRTTRPDVEVEPEQIAYIGYTSGSTGRPKGVLVPHRAIDRLVLGADFLDVRADDVFLQFSPLAFDASTLEVWAPLLNGATLVIAPDGNLGPRELVEVVHREGVTVLWLTAALFDQVAQGPLDGLSGLRTLIAGGDVLAVPSVDRVLTTLPGVRVVNGYGPTENTTFTCCHEITPPVVDTVPIGRPINGTAGYVLDENLIPVPVGEPGELFAGGLGVARGYLGQPGPTAEKFVPDPFSGRFGARLYRTGDRVRERPDGVLEFLGRLDKQVKIRGFRVEPGEVEAELVARPELRGAAVVAQGTCDGKRLVAFVVPRHPVSASALRAGLRETLPDYAVPAAVVIVDELPLTPHGKVDRTALENRLVQGRPDDLMTDYREPATPTEVTLAAVWADLIGVFPVGADDDFFELGGHSLLAARVTAAIAAVFDVTVTQRSCYENPTVAELAGLVDELRSERV